jgi:hypothetical protein
VGLYQFDTVVPITCWGGGGRGDKRARGQDGGREWTTRKVDEVASVSGYGTYTVQYLERNESWRYQDGWLDGHKE